MLLIILDLTGKPQPIDKDKQPTQQSLEAQYQRNLLWRNEEFSRPSDENWQQSHQHLQQQWLSSSQNIEGMELPQRLPTRPINAGHAGPQLRPNFNQKYQYASNPMASLRHSFNRNQYAPPSRGRGTELNYSQYQSGNNPNYVGNSTMQRSQQPANWFPSQGGWN